MLHPDYPFWNLIALVLVLLPAPWHWRAHNIATVSLIVWLTFANLCGFINTIIWSGSYADKSPVWCDITLAVRWFLIRRLQFRTILASSDSKLSIGRYIRLIALAVTDSTVVLVVIVYAAVNALSDSSLPMRPYRDWAYVHQDFSQISQYPEELFSSSWPAVVMNVYAPILYSILFFAFFGFGEEAVSEYLAIGDKVIQLLETMGFMCKRSGSVFKDLRIDLGSKVVPAFDGNNLESTSLGDLRDDTSEKGFQSLESRAEKVTPLNNMGIAVRVERSVVI
ncbi:hypothetical protein I314_03631 [Cryptococcus bacillisporus CA1873]|uniref:STE3 n=1 Tax=Cryptococcus bacillisporus CA1873 TaxID=1296111 RepID=A0ABR5B9T7_CRYGA|nr:hypothetical protein I314_03631 [Cryptococcus bacillisporus CA1873]|eukprot:KIR60340.1 hypothetical protein I314_03631 [Cryptococcus gattii CA1873]